MPEKAVLPDLVLDLTSFQLVRAGRPIKLEKTPMEVLTVLVRKRGALVSRDEIVHAIWGDAVHVDVDAGINTAIRKIRHALDDDSASPRYLETVVGKGYRFIGEITVINGDVSTAPSSPAKSAGHSREVKAALVVGAGLAAVLLLAIAAAVHRDNSAVVAPQGRVVIAVVPLQNLSQNPGQDYFTDGLTDEILTQLGQLNPQQLGVLKYGSPATAANGKPAITDAGLPSNLQYWLEGSVRRQGEEARISVRLLRADKTTVWTESFDRSAGDMLSLQSEIAQRIGHELQIQVLGRANPKPVKPEVVEAYLRGRFELSRHQAADAARSYFEAAIALDPFYAPAFTGLADFYRSRAMLDDEGAEEAWRLAEQYSTQALSLDPESAETHAAIAQIKLLHDWDWPAAREHALRALQLNPSSPEAHSVYARYVRTAGNMGEALSHRKQAVALDPFRVDLKIELMFEYFFARDYKSGAALARELIAFDPEQGHGALCFDLGYLGLFDESVAECSKAYALGGHADWVPGFEREYHERGYEAARLFLAKKELNQMLKRPHPDIWYLANAYALAGKPKESLRTLFQGLRIREGGLLQIRVDPDFDPIRSDPRYTELVRQIGFPSE